MNHALAAIISVTVNLAWFAVFAWCVWRMVTGLVRVRRRMRAMPDYRGPSFFWTWQTLAFAIREKPRQEDSRRLLSGWLGAIGLCVVMAIVGSVLVVVLSPQ